MQSNLRHYLLEHMQATLIQVGADFKVEYINDAGEELLEISSKRIVSHPVTDFFIEEDAENGDFDLLAALQQVEKTGQPFIRRAVTLRLHNLKHKHVDYSVTLLPSDGQTSDHSPHQFLFEVHEIDRLLRMSREEHMIHQHQVAQQLVRNVAHEIKNPLGGIRGATQLLAKALPDSTYAEYTNIILEEVDRLKQLADQMLGVKNRPQMELLNIHEPLDHVLKLLKPQAADQICLIKDYDLSLPEIKADAAQLIQVFLNIAMNALQAISENQALNQQKGKLIFRTRFERLVTLRNQLYKQAIKIEIEDNGPGISTDLMDTLFFPLVTGRANGTGLGLSIAQNIIHAHHGVIECQSRPHQTILQVYLPLEH